jgi:CxxC motif-containing protein
VVTIDGDNIDVTGNTCKRGYDYGVKEVTNPTRVVTTTVPVSDGVDLRVSCKTSGDVPKDKMIDVIKDLTEVSINAPVAIGDVIKANVANTGIDIVATKNVSKKKSNLKATEVPKHEYKKAI